MTTVLVVDDQPLIRSAVAQLLATDPGIEVVGEAADGREALNSARTLRPDVVLMDIRMPRMDGIAATEAISAEPSLTTTRVLILTTFEEDRYLFAALRAGASGFIGKGAEPGEIAHAVKAVHRGDALLSPVATRSLITKYLESEPRSGRFESRRLDELTPREREVLVLVARGSSNDEIAGELFISPHTAKTHVNRVMTKLGAHDRAQLVVWAYECGLVSPGR